MNDIQNHEKELIKGILKLSRYAKFDYLLDKNTFSTRDVKRYYKKTKYLLYRLAAKSIGYMHIGLSDDGKYHKDGMLFQLKHIQKLICDTHAKTVLELGSGQGSNLGYLSKRVKDVDFTGLDLYPSLDRKNRRENVKIIQGDYHELKEIPSNSVDLVYAIETLCYSTNKSQIFKEVNRVLKKDGLFIIFDAYMAKPRNKLSQIENLCATLIENGYYLDEFEYIENIEKYAKGNRLEVVEARCLNKESLPSLESYKKKIDKLCKFGFLFRVACSIVPKEVAGNIVPIYFMEDAIKMELAVYYKHVFRKVK